MSSLPGPLFRLVDEVDGRDLDRDGGFGNRGTPLLVKGAVRRWPAWDRWTFENLAALRHPDGSEVVTRFQNGLVEQGRTRTPLRLPVAPYLLELAANAENARREHRGDVGLLSDRRRERLGKGETFHLDWSYMRSFQANRVYLAQWYILEEFPELRRDFAIRDLWPGLRWTWEYVFIGPAHTVTGLHFDFPNNWFCQVRGVKEVVVLPPENAPNMRPSRKYDWGATLSDVDISRLAEQPEEMESFSRATGGVYARVEPGDALFIPRRNWHAVVAREPCISLAVFGLTAWEIVNGGGRKTALDWLHKLRLYRRGNCTCHEMAAREGGAGRRDRTGEAPTGLPQAGIEPPPARGPPASRKG